MALSNAVLDFLSARGALKPLNQRVGEALEAPVIEGGAPVPASIGGIGGPVSTPVDSPAPRQIPLNERIGQWMEKPVIDGGAPIPETLGGPDRPQLAASHQPYSSPDMVSSHGMAPPTPVVATQERRSPVGRANTPGPQSELPTASEFVPQPVDREGSIVPSGAGLLAANPSSPSLPDPSAPTDNDPYSFIPQEIRDLYTKKDPRFSDEELRKAQEADNRSRGLQDAGNGFKRATSLITGTPYREAAIKVNGVQDFLTRRGLAEQESQGEKQLALYAIAEMAKARESGRRLTLEQAKEIARQNWEAQKAATEHGYRMEEQGAGREFTREQNNLNRKTQIQAANLRSRGSVGGMGDDGAKEIAQAIERGEQPPDMKGLYRFGAPVRAELARNGFDLTTANRDWQAVQRHVATLNGPQQERLRQAVTFTYDSLDVVEKLYNEWQRVGTASGIKLFNRAALAASKNMPGEPGATAQALEAQINDLVSELATVYKGGNASTDESLKLAAQNLKSDWNPETFKKAIGLLRTNLKIRRNSIYNSEPVGVSEGSRYVEKPKDSAPVPKRSVTINGVTYEEE